jgi:hypothetical protein
VLDGSLSAVAVGGTRSVGVRRPYANRIAQRARRGHPRTCDTRQGSRFSASSASWRPRIATPKAP